MSSLLRSFLNRIWPAIVQHRTGTEASLSQLKGYPGEVTISTDLRRLHAHDGVTPGGRTFGPGNWIVFEQHSPLSNLSGSAETVISRDANGSRNPFTIPAGQLLNVGDMIAVELLLFFQNTSSHKGIGLYFNSSVPDGSYGLDIWGGNLDATNPPLTNTQPAATGHLLTRIVLKRISTNVAASLVGWFNHLVISNITGIADVSGISAGYPFLLTPANNDCTSQQSLLVTANASNANANEVSLQYASAIYSAYK